MRGDKILVEQHHRNAAQIIVDDILTKVTDSERKYIITVGGESGSGKSEVAAAIADALKERGILTAILQQDDYFVYPPKTNDLTRRKDINWVGPKEVRLDLLDKNLMDIREGRDKINKPLVIYDEDRIDSETINFDPVRVVVAEGTYTSMLKNADIRVFIDRDFNDTKAHRVKRVRDDSELDEFVERVLKIEHEIISSHKARANFIIKRDYDVEFIKM
jgi:uridine kinase